MRMKIATEADLTAPFRYELPKPKVISTVGGAVSVLSNLIRILEEDVIWFQNMRRVEPALSHRFILLVHETEIEGAEILLPTSLRPFVWLAKIETGIPYTADYSLYISDITALGLNPDLVSESDYINSQIAFAKKVVYIKGNFHGAV